MIPSELAEVRNRAFALEVGGRVAGYLYLDVRRDSRSDGSSGKRLDWIVGGDPNLLDCDWADGNVDLGEEGREADFRERVWDVYGVRCDLRELPPDKELELLSDYFALT